MWFSEVQRKNFTVQRNMFPDAACDINSLNLQSFWKPRSFSGDNEINDPINKVCFLKITRKLTGDLEKTNENHSLLQQNKENEHVFMSCSGFWTKHCQTQWKVHDHQFLFGAFKSLCVLYILTIFIVFFVFKNTEQDISAQVGQACRSCLTGSTSTAIKQGANVHTDGRHERLPDNTSCLLIQFRRKHFHSVESPFKWCSIVRDLFLVCFVIRNVLYWATVIK